MGRLFKSHSCAGPSRMFERCSLRSANLPVSRRDLERGRGGFSLLQTCGVGQGFAYAMGLLVAMICGLSDLYIWDITDWQETTKNEVEEAE